MSALLPVYPRLDLELRSAEGCELHTADGRTVLDLYGGHAVCPLGHAHPAVVEALREAHQELDFYSNSLHMPVQQRAAAAVLAGSGHLSHVHFVNSGTEANEAALHLARRLTGRTTVVSFDCSFHGRTQASLAATGMPQYRARLSLPADPAHHRFLALGDVDALARTIDETTAAVLCESVPSLAGVFLPTAEYYAALQARCRELGAMLIFDEVQGGVGRLGTWFAHQRFGVTPDLVTLAKGLGNGYPVGAVLTTPEIASRVEAGELGSTFGGGPVACRLAETVARVIHEDELMPRTGEIFQRLRKGLAAHPGVQVRGAGCLIGIQTGLPARELQARLLRRKILVGTSAQPSTIRLLPPYVLSNVQIDHFLLAIDEALRG